MAGRSCASQDYDAEWAGMFERHLSDWCEAENIVSEFCYLHPMMGAFQRMLVKAPTHIVKNVVVIDLDKFSEQTVRATFAAASSRRAMTA